MLIALLVPLSLAILFFAVVLVKDAVAKRAGPSFEAVLLGAVVSFFDTLGIGSFAPTAAWLKFRRLVPDRLLPPTMLVGRNLSRNTSLAESSKSKVPFKRLGLPSAFTHEVGDQDYLRTIHGLSEDGVLRALKPFLDTLQA